jgi:hypothetical protein
MKLGGLHSILAIATRRVGLTADLGARLAKLADEAAEAGDEAQLRLCERALTGHAGAAAGCELVLSCAEQRASEDR